MDGYNWRHLEYSGAFYRFVMVRETQPVPYCSVRLFLSGVNSLLFTEPAAGLRLLLSWGLLCAFPSVVPSTLTFSFSHLSFSLTSPSTLSLSLSVSLLRSPAPPIEPSLSCKLRMARQRLTFASVWAFEDLGVKEIQTRLKDTSLHADLVCEYEKRGDVSSYPDLSTLSSSLTLSGGSRCL